MEFFNTKWTRYFQLSCSLLGCETNQLLFLSQLVTHRLHGPPADKFPLFSRVMGWEQWWNFQTVALSNRLMNPEGKQLHLYIIASEKNHSNSW